MTTSSSYSAPPSMPEPSQPLPMVHNFYIANHFSPALVSGPACGTAVAPLSPPPPETFTPPPESSLIRTTAVYIGSAQDLIAASSSAVSAAVTNGSSVSATGDRKALGLSGAAGAAGATGAANAAGASVKPKRKRVRAPRPPRSPSDTPQKPHNCFIMYRSDKQKELIKLYPDWTQTQVSCRAAEMWHLEPESVRENYRIKARAIRKEYERLYGPIRGNGAKTASGAHERQRTARCASAAAVASAAGGVYELGGSRMSRRGGSDGGSGSPGSMMGYGGSVDSGMMFGGYYDANQAMIKEMLSSLAAVETKTNGPGQPGWFMPLPLQTTGHVSNEQGFEEAGSLSMLNTFINDTADKFPMADGGIARGMMSPLSLLSPASSASQLAPLLNSSNTTMASLVPSVFQHASYHPLGLTSTNTQLEIQSPSPLAAAMIGSSASAPVPGTGSSSVPPPTQASHPPNFDATLSAIAVASAAASGYMHLLPQNARSVSTPFHGGNWLTPYNNGSVGMGDLVPRALPEPVPENATASAIIGSKGGMVEHISQVAPLPVPSYAT